MTLRIHGRRALKTPSDHSIRPTSSRVRQSVFGILQDRVEGSRWLDLCSGAGTMGAEALSRGAAFVLGVDSSRRACDITRANWQKLNVPAESTRIIRGDIRAVLRRIKAGLFDVIYLDPPYESNVYDEVLHLLPALLLPDGFLFVEHSEKRLLPERIGTLQMTSRRKIGQAQLSIYRHAPALLETNPPRPGP